MKSKTVFVSILFIFISIKSASANFFKNITDLIDNNYESLRYGISVADVNNDGSYEFIVAGFGSENLALSYKNNKLCLLYTSPSPRDISGSRMPSSA